MQMNKFSRAFVSLALGGLCFQPFQPIWADELSGPGRISVCNESWGAVYYAPMYLRDYSYRREVDQNLRLMTTHHGQVKILDNGLGRYEISFVHSKASVEGTAGEAKVVFGGKTYEFLRKGDTFLIKTPEDTITYKFQPHQIVITGKRGTTKITEKEGDYRIESPQGVYTYNPVGSDGFDVKGGPLARHTYIFRGALFEEEGVGFFIDFKKLDPDSLLFRFVEWAPLLEFQGKSPEGKKSPK